MGDGEVGGVDDLFAIEEDVDIDNAVAIVAIYGLVGATHLSLDGLGDFEQFVGSVVCVDGHHGIEEMVGRLEPPGGGLYIGRASKQMTCLLAYHFYGLVNVCFAVAQVGAYAEISFHLSQ